MATRCPSVDTLARGVATFQLSDDGTELTYRLVVANIENVVAAHIHLAPAGVNGPVVAFLSIPGAPSRRRERRRWPQGTSPLPTSSGRSPANR